MVQPPSFSKRSSYPNNGRVTGPAWTVMWEITADYRWHDRADLADAGVQTGAARQTCTDLLRRATRAGILQQELRVATGGRARAWHRRAKPGSGVQRVVDRHHDNLNNQVLAAVRSAGQLNSYRDLYRYLRQLGVRAREELIDEEVKRLIEEGVIRAEPGLRRAVMLRPV